MATKKKLLQAAAGNAGGVGAWDLSYAYYDPPAGLTWDLSSANYTSLNFSVNSQEASAQGMFFKSDGTKMYITGSGGSDVNEYDLTTAWNVESASYLQNFSVSAQETSPTGLFFKPDGTKMFVMGISGDAVYEYDLSTAWDISSASYSQNFSVSAQDGSPQDVFFKSDGTKMYMLGSGSDRVYEYDLSTAWDVSTASFLQNKNISAQGGTPMGMSFKADGTKMFVVDGSGTDDVNEYDLSTAWDVSSASFSQDFTIGGQDGTPTSIFFRPEGSGFYMLGDTGNKVYQYSLAGFSVATQDTSPKDVFFKPDGTKMYFVGTQGDDVNEYDLSTSWDLSTASYLQNFSVAAQDAAPSDIFFKPDGTKMYITGQTGDDVNEYDLSTAWNISTASYLQNFSVSAQEANPNGVFFRDDGTKMYIVGSSGDEVNEYDLSTAWDISTASYLQNFSVSAQETNPQGLFFKDDGTKMYICGNQGDDVNEYDLSTAWDISSASFSQVFDVEPQAKNPTGLFFRDDGTKMYIISDSEDAIYAYTLGPQD
jgi:DNA-binding beta-propeller fold protein YncE